MFKKEDEVEYITTSGTYIKIKQSNSINEGLKGKPIKNSIDRETI